MDDNTSKNTLLQADQESKLLQCNQKSERQLERIKLCYSKRLLIVFFIGIGYMSLISLRTNLSIAIVEMTSENSSSNNTANRTINLKTAEFDWNSKQKGFALSAFSYGYMFSPIGGIMGSRFGGATVFGFGVAFTALTTLLTPILVYTNFYLFITTRILEGIFEACAMASVPEIWSRWAPSDERATMTSLSNLGFIVGSIVYFPLNGFIAKIWGWPSIFYVTGVVPLVWSLFWFSLVYNDPIEDKYISDEEKEYLKKTINRKLKDKVDYSLKSIFTSKPMWALWSLKVAASCGYTFVYIYFPQYVKDISNIDITEVGFISAIPHLCAFFLTPLTSIVADYLRGGTKLSHTRVHKLFASIGHIAVAIFFVTMTFTNVTGSIICTCLITIFIECFVDIVISVSILDLAPRYASFLWGINNMFFTLGAIMTPMFIGYVVTSHSVSEWNTCFLTFSVLYAAVILIYLLFGSGKLRTWSLHPDEKYEPR